MTLCDMTGKVAVITGSTKGIGKAIACRMAEHGANVVVSSRKAEACDAVAAAINRESAQAGNKATALPCHVQHQEQLRHIVAPCTQKTRHIQLRGLRRADGPSSGCTTR